MILAVSVKKVNMKIKRVYAICTAFNSVPKTCSKNGSTKSLAICKVSVINKVQQTVRCSEVAR